MLHVITHRSTISLCLILTFIRFRSWYNQWSKATEFQPEWNISSTRKKKLLGKQRKERWFRSCFNCKECKRSFNCEICHYLGRWKISSIWDGVPENSGGGHGNPLLYSCLENPMDRGAWWARVQWVTKSWTWLKRLSTHTRELSGITGLLFDECHIWPWSSEAGTPLHPEDLLTWRPCSLAASVLHHPHASNPPHPLKASTVSMRLCTFLGCIYIEVAVLPRSSERKQSGDNF